ncbi:MAG: flap endonuclease [Sandaracinaceae bacterium]|nr:flap endonuclease [Sandaracinaceae bacterium]
MRVHLLDGTYELFRMHFGAPRATDPSGREVGAVRAMLRSFLVLLDQDDVSHVGVAFDHVIESFRNDLFHGYKTGEGLEPELWAQFELAERACRALGIVVWPMVEHEADDALATAAARWRDDPRVEQIIIASPDKDLCQCVRGTRVILWDRLRRKTLDEAGVIEKHGVPPAAIPDLLALVGDTADGIPGIPRWGAKSAAAVLAHFGSLEAIPLDADAWDIKVRGAATLATNLAAQREDAALYKVLATLREDATVPEQDLDELEWRGADREALAAIDAELGDTMSARVTRWR